MRTWVEMRTILRPSKPAKRLDTRRRNIQKPLRRVGMTKFINYLP